MFTFVSHNNNIEVYLLTMTEKELKREIIPREPEQQTALRRSQIPFYITAASQTVLIIIFFTIVGIFFNFAAASLGWPVLIANGVIVLIAAVIASAMFIFGLASYNSVSYLLQPGYIQRTNEQIIDQIPGKVLVKTSFLHRSKRLLTMKEYDHVKIEKSIWGRIFGYGSIYLEQKDELEKTQRYILQNVIDPEKAATLIQHMMDLEITDPMPMMAPPPEEKGDQT